MSGLAKKLVIFAAVDGLFLQPTGQRLSISDQSVGVKDGITKVRKLLTAKYNWDGKFSFIHHGSTIGK